MVTAAVFEDGSVRFVISLLKDPDEATTQRSRHASTIALLREWFSEEIEKGWLLIGVSDCDFFHPAGTRIGPTS